MLWKPLPCYSLGQVLIEEIRHSCLPRLVCELFAMEDKSSLTESEISLMSLIRQTSLSSRASYSSNYHFAAHMGQLLVGIDGNGCQNFYPACPLAGHQVSRKGIYKQIIYCKI